MKWTNEDIPDLDGKICIVTGANSGLGYHTSLELARKGANVIMACRNIEKGENAANSIRSIVKNAKLDLSKLDLADLDSVKSFAEDIKKDYKKLDLLINNAGLMAIPEARTKQGFEMQLGTNHIGHFALTAQLFTLLNNTENSRVVTLSSMAHKFGKIKFNDLNFNSSYNKWAAYSQSKLANLMFAAELHRRIKTANRNVTSVACHPGWAETNLQTKGAKISGSSIEKFFTNLANRLFAQSAEMGALPNLYAATSENVHGGKYYGPDKLGGMRGYPREEMINRRKVDQIVSRNLWEVTEEITGIKFEV